MTTIINFTADDVDRLQTAHKIRKKVFVEEQLVDPKLELDDDDSNSIHFLLYVKQKKNLNKF